MVFHLNAWRGATALWRTGQHSLLCNRSPQQYTFSTKAALGARNKGRGTQDARITQIKYFLRHPLTPRPLRFSRERHLRHWTIHRAWHLYQSDLRRTRELELEKQYNSMRSACEALRLMDAHGNTPGPSSEGQTTGRPTPQKTDVGRLYRVAMHKKDIWRGVPIEYARIQTDGPPTDGWDHAWTR